MPKIILLEILKRFNGVAERSAVVVRFLQLLEVCRQPSILRLKVTDDTERFVKGQNFAVHFTKLILNI